MVRGGMRSPVLRALDCVRVSAAREIAREPDSLLTVPSFIRGTFNIINERADGIGQGAIRQRIQERTLTRCLEKNQSRVHIRIHKLFFGATRSHPFASKPTEVGLKQAERRATVSDGIGLQP